MSTATLPRPLTEVSARFACFGTNVGILASAETADAAHAAVARARTIALDVHRRLTTFDAGSDLSLLNADPRPRVPAGRLVRRMAESAHWAGEATGGLVDATCPLADEGAAGGWALVRADATSVTRPPGVRLDSGGLAKGLAADLMAEALRGCAAWAVDCAGDLRLGGTAGLERVVHVAGLAPGDAPLHELRLDRAAVATSGVTRRAWVGGHHIIDPRTGRPADTGLAQVTAIAPTGLVAEVRAKAALLTGPSHAAEHLPDGGVLVTAEGRVTVVRPGATR